MKNIIKVILMLALGAVAYGQQNVLGQTSLSVASGARDTSFRVASATGINAPTTSVPGSMLYIVDPGEQIGQLVEVLAVSGTTITGQPTGGGANGNAHVSGAMVLVATNPKWFSTFTPTGPCVTASILVSPVLNTNTGEQRFCSSKTLTWVPGWGVAPNAGQVITATATASVAGATAISSPLVHISGTNAITSFTMSVGWQNNPFCVIPDGAFTGTATNNIGKAFTAVANRTLCFTWDGVNSAFTPSY